MSSQFCEIEWKQSARSCKEEWEQYICSPLTQPLIENVLNYDPINDTVYCPILLDHFDFDDCTVATCCWNAYESNIFSTLLKENKTCAICRRELLQCYITIYDHYYNIYKNFRPKIGININWTIYQMKEAIETKTKYKNVSKIMLGKYNLLAYDNNIKLLNYGIKNCGILTIW
jgi:hypothetical protein